MSTKDNLEQVPEETSTNPTFPFPEWSDTQVNQEQWELATKEKKGDARKQSAPPETQVPPEKTYFTDEQVVLLPSSINANEWKRLVDVYPDADFVISQGIIDFAGLKDGSKNVMHSEFMRSFISTIGILEYMGVTNPWPIESVTSGYFPNTGKEPWKPWHHIYSLCKAGKGTHSPKFNRSGKYIVRLHWMGCWRKVYVDDHLPVDAENNILLPNFMHRPEPEVEPDSDKVKKSSKSKRGGKDKKDKKSSKSKKGSKDKKGKKDKASKKKDKSDKQDTKKQPPKMIVEIWQFILCKALLKIASLSWNDSSELVDFCPTSCLTGWVFQKLDTLGMSSLDIWRICESFAPKFEWEAERVKSATGKKNKKNASEKGSKGSKKRSKDSKKDNKSSKKKSSKKKSSKSSKSSKGSKKSKSKKGDAKTSESNILPYVMVATCFDIRKLTDEEALQDIPATWSCDILIEQVRDIPLVKPPPKAEYARWKRFRWIAWALRKGIISPDDDFNVQCLKLFSSLNKCPEIDRKAISAKSTKSDKSKKSSKGSKKSSKSSKKSSKSSKKSSKSGKSKKGQVKTFPQLDRSVWIDFSKVQYAITIVYVFFKPSQFHTKIKLSDTARKNEEQNKPAKKDKKTPEVQEMYYPSELRESHNEPLYIFSDTLDHKFLVINLNQMGNVQRLLEKPEAKQDFCYLTVEVYDWQTNQCGDVFLFANTRATKTALVYFKPGRFLCKLWVKSDNYFTMMILAETPVIVGNHRTLVDAMTSESLSLTKLSHDVSTNFGKLVQSFGTPSYLESMRTFYSTYKSDFSVVPKTSAHEIYRAFLSEVMNILANAELKFALKVLFLDPSLTIFKSGNEVLKSQDETDVGFAFGEGEDEVDPKQLELAAVKIQSVLKCICVKKLLSLHNANNVKYVTVYDNLRKIYGQVFSLQNRKSCVVLIRNVFCQLANDDYVQKYPVAKDLRSVVTLQSFNESIPTNEGAWVLLIRKKFFCISTSPIKIGVYCYCPLKKYVVRVFDNDSGEESFRCTNSVAVCSYKKNSRGYTALSYGWAEEAAAIPSTLYIICQKEAKPQMYIPEQATYETSLVDCYKPNVNNQICKCVLDVNQNTTVTLRLLTSYNAAKIRLYCMNEYGQILNEIFGKGDVVLPVTHLEVAPEKSNSFQKSSILETQKIENTQRGKSTSSQKQHRSKTSVKSNSRLLSTVSLVETPRKDFYVEAFVLEDSWPLTRREWMVVVDERKKSLLYPNETGDFYMKMRSDFLPFEGRGEKSARENPYWQLNVIYDTSEALILSNDERRVAEIRSIKQEWYEDDPNRAAKSREIREKYLQTHIANYIGSSSDSLLLPKLNQASSFLAMAKPTAGKTSLNRVTRSKTSPRSASSLKMSLSSPLHSKSSANSSRDLIAVDSPTASFRTNSATPSLSNNFANKLASEERLIQWNPVIEMLAPFDMDKFMENIENVSIDDRLVVTEEWEQLEEYNRTEAREAYFQELHDYQDNMDKVLCDQIENFIILQQWQDENKEESANKIKSAYKLRDKFIEYLIQLKATIDAHSKDKKKGKTGSKKSSTGSKSKKGSKKSSASSKSKKGSKK